MNKVRTLFIALSIVCFGSSSFAVTFTCERTTSDFSNFASKEIFESWWPDRITLDGNEFKEAPGNSKSMKFEKDIRSSSGQSYTRKLVLLPSGVLIGSFKGASYGGVSEVVRYECDLNSTELRTKSPTPKPSTVGQKNLSQSQKNTLVKKYSKSNTSKTDYCYINPKACNDEELCNRAISNVTGQNVWDTSSEWEPYVNEAKSRELSCDVGSTSNTIERRLKKVKSLLNKGLINPKEAAGKRKQILSEF